MPAFYVVTTFYDLQAHVTAKSSPHPCILLFHLIPSTHLRLGLPNFHFPSGLPTKTVYALFISPTRSTYLTHLSNQPLSGRPNAIL